MDWFSDDMVSRGLDEAEVDGIFLDDLALLLSREPFAARFHLHRLGQNASWTFERNNIVEILRYAIAKAKGLELRMKATAMNDDDEVGSLGQSRLTRSRVRPMRRGCVSPVTAGVQCCCIGQGQAVGARSMMHISAKRVPEHHLVEHHGAWWAYTGEPPPLEAFRSHKRPPGSKSYVWIQTAPRGERIPAGAIVEGWYTVVDGTIRVADNDDRTIGKRKLEPVRDWQQCL